MFLDLLIGRIYFLKTNFMIRQNYLLAFSLLAVIVVTILFYKSLYWPTTEIIAVSGDEELQESLWNESLSDCQAKDDTDCLIAVYREMYEAGSWVGVSGLVSTYRRIGDTEAAYSVTAEVAADKPDLAGLMLIWDGDTALTQEDKMDFYNKAHTEYGDQLLDAETPIGVLALGYISNLLVSEDRALAGETYRQILLEYPDYVDPIDILAEALILEASGTTPGTLLEGGNCSSLSPCIIENGTIEQVDQVPDGFSPLVGSTYEDAFYFRLSEEDQAIFDAYSE